MATIAGIDETTYRRMLEELRRGPSCGARLGTPPLLQQAKLGSPAAPAAAVRTFNRTHEMPFAGHPLSHSAPLAGHL